MNKTKLQWFLLVAASSAAIAGCSPKTQTAYDQQLVESGSGGTDAGPSNPCGDGWCNGDETASNCPQDCGSGGSDAGPSDPCGDGECIGDETASNCPQDCGSGGSDAGPSYVCGDGWCNGDETASSCPQDCGSGGSDAGPSYVCGDGTCNGDETASSCPEDCGSGGGDGCLVGSGGAPAYPDLCTAEPPSNAPAAVGSRVIQDGIDGGIACLSRPAGQGCTTCCAQRSTPTLEAGALGACIAQCDTGIPIELAVVNPACRLAPAQAGFCTQYMTDNAALGAQAFRTWSYISNVATGFCALFVARQVTCAGLLTAVGAARARVDGPATSFLSGLYTTLCSS